MTAVQLFGAVVSLCAGAAIGAVGWRYRRGVRQFGEPYTYGQGQIIYSLFGLAAGGFVLGAKLLIMVFER